MPLKIHPIQNRNITKIKKISIPNGFKNKNHTWIYIETIKLPRQRKTGSLYYINPERTSCSY